MDAHRRPGGDPETQTRVVALAQPADPEKRRFLGRLLEANMSLVLEAARVLRGRGVPFSDLVQEGSLALIGAVEMVDPSVGPEFERQATFAIRRRLRDVVDATDRAETKSRGLLVHALAPDPQERTLEVERIEKTRTLLAMLAEDQQRVIKLRFGIDSPKPFTLEAVAQSLGINRWRASGLESRALVALRRAVHRLRWTFPR